MFGWFKVDPQKKLQKQLAEKRTAAVQLQRDGKLREFAAVSAEIEALEAELEALHSRTA